LIGSTGIRTCFLLIEPVWATFHLGLIFISVPLLCIELDNQRATFVYNAPQSSDFTQINRKNALRRFPTRDIVLTFDYKEIWIIDF
jgi:hypothetical protein